ncbi:alpha/beta hydrolase [Ramlibacter sp.]|uniref:alpha/beta hydrolase n=1 Tax=Ramlibacter sp. TaxID=1917967 RepID=UPI002C2664EE|nr:alpha/beta hydrolase [Ramlibacter sp.]HWI81258.1 alpha/beta hydrolase [Ramlibacter sp.]
MYLPHYPHLTPAMRSVLQRMARATYPPIHSLTPQAARAAYERGASVLELPKVQLARVEDFTIPGRDGQPLPARLYAPGHGALPVLLYFHGGGCVVGSIETHDVLCRELSRLSGCAVVSLGYRLAPEHPFPAPVHDAWDATQWLARHAGELGLDGTRLAVGGDSAGGTLAAVCAIMARDAGLPLALQILIYPNTAPTREAASHERFATGLLLDQEHIDWFFDHYIAPQQRGDWRFAPLVAPDVEGVAPAWIGLAEYDPTVDDGIAYADKLRAAHVAVDIEIYRGVTHEFIKLGRAIREARQAHADAARALAQALEPATP